MAHMQGPTGLACAASEEHASAKGKHQECPERVRTIWEKLTREGLVARCNFVECREVDLDELYLAHAEGYVEKMRGVEYLKTQQDLDALLQNYNLFDSYFTRGTFKSASIAVGGILELMKGVLTGDLANGFAVIRPPGHHVEFDECRGFGIFNNVAVAAVTARVRFGVPRVMIVDWDVYHGTGTQHLFEEDNSVLYFSAHRFDNGSFFPGSKSAAASSVGSSSARGLNVNVAWNGPGMGDDEYLAAWQCVLLPIATEFRPDLIIVSAGFSAAAGDVGWATGEGGVTPEGFAQLTRILMSVCPRVVLVLEGGYDLAVLPDCACACTKALLGEDIRLRTEVRPNRDARAAIEQTLRAQRQFWRSLSDYSDINVLSAPTIPLQDPAKIALQPAFSARDEAYPDDIQAALKQMEALQEKLKLFSEDFHTEEEDELRWQLQEVNFEIREMMNLHREASVTGGYSGGPSAKLDNLPDHREVFTEKRTRPPPSASRQEGGDLPRRADSLSTLAANAGIQGCCGLQRG